MSANGSSSPFQPFEPRPAERPKDVGIHAIELYFPMRGISQVDLEQFDGVSAGKYTIGLGQEKMTFCDDREDIVSFLMTATASLLKKYNVPTSSIGRIDVGTETLIDKAKSVKSHLMDLFPGNTDIEGLDSKNACYGGTAALFNACNWVESSNWDGRYALVVAGDIAIYAAGGARPVGGAGAVAMLIGPNAPLVMEPIHGTHMANVYDFYKPHLSSEYPEVDGPLTQTSYPGALEKSYDHWRQKEAQRLGKKGDMSAASVEDFDYLAFHSPYGKLVQKGFARLMYNDYLSNPTAERFASVPPELKDLDRSKTLLDKNVEKAFMAVSKEPFAAKTGPCMLTSKKIGNMYTASLYGALASLLDTVSSETLQGKRIGMYSYGSGLAASFFSLKVKGSTEQMQKQLGLQQRLAKTEVRSCQEYLDALQLREDKHNIDNWTPDGKVENIAEGTYYLIKNDEKHRRTYVLRGSEQ
ncbi:hydroxymethylglutaryl-CoA synthase [Microbotryum lychnidis-dioicae p1A1 Lamole]|uniref:Hydroxymethylglutaryl-CoA synthase n=1 Tax=Microbotryum lychnidis-dioicae (strain p1A1 Lamole / MvSl-1064) TaxID=683840 RepID=U5H5U4_USTV1|nr:hydroxymethylglutaryl-CoA synthase [Microbotryum lychnidis-dioicae p1A1 Lamole]|eukprot:KDE07083.1 hydroxymethylglutaryl-CoA synthase [Microbotryum lychnidis-dioicae p1A1 Lamole]